MERRPASLSGLLIGAGIVIISICVLCMADKLGMHGIGVWAGIALVLLGLGGLFR